MNRLARRVINLTLVTIVMTLVTVSLRASLSAQATDSVDTEKQTVIRLLQVQADAWNQGDLEAFMATYWKSEQLTFSSGGQTTRGWQATLDRYRMRYPNAEAMGVLRFDETEFQLLSRNVALVLGRWHLKRIADTPQGNFSLILKKIEGKWRIIHDHSSTLEDD